jgi:hypothetical protein
MTELTCSIAGLIIAGIDIHQTQRAQSLFFFMFSADLPSLKLWHGKDAGKHKAAIARGEQERIADASFKSVSKYLNLQATDVY